MFTRKQVMEITEDYIEPIFNMTKKFVHIDEDESLTNGHCFYFAERLSKFLQGRWRNVNVENLSDEEKEIRNSEIGRVCSVNTDHYFVEYNGDYYDGNGVMYHDPGSIWLWRYIDINTGKPMDPEFDAKSFPKLDLYYQGDKEQFDAEASVTKDYYKTAVWEIYDLVFNQIANELIPKLEKEAEIQNAKDPKEQEIEGFKRILKDYCYSSINLIIYNSDIKEKIKEIVDKVRKIDLEEQEKRIKAMEEWKAKRGKVTTWADLMKDPKKLEEYTHSEEFYKLHPELRPGTDPWTVIPKKTVAPEDVDSTSAETPEDSTPTDGQKKGL